MGSGPILRSITLARSDRITLGILFLTGGGLVGGPSHSSAASGIYPQPENSSNSKDFHSPVKLRMLTQARHLPSVQNAILWPCLQRVEPALLSNKRLGSMIDGGAGRARSLSNKGAQ